MKTTKMGYHAGYKAAQILRDPTISNVTIIKEYGCVERKQAGNEAKQREEGNDTQNR